jgi:hypothetical protein
MMERSFRSRWLFPSLALALALLGAAVLAGCDAGRTETGYEPHRLTMNGTQIRTLYAPAFSPEAQAARDEQKQTMHNVHAGPGGY